MAGEPTAGGRRARRLRTRLAVALLAVCALPSAASAAAWQRCGAGSGARCERITVPLDRSGGMPGTIGLRVARLPGPPGAPTLVYLSGGPGSGGLSELEGVLWGLSSLRALFRLATFDQRGTGASGVLRCPALERDPRLRSTAAGEACALRLGAARRHYTTADSVEDLEAVRRALGVERLTLLGVSYGTELALAYARAHPDRVQRLVLDSVVDPDDGDPFALAGPRAMGPRLAALCPDGCRGVSADPGADLARLVERLRAAPLTGRVVDARGRARTRRLDGVAITDLMYDADYRPPLRAAVPAAVRAALGGDAAPLLRLAAVGDAFSAPEPPRVFSAARYAAICEEAPLPWDATTPLADRRTEARRRATALGPDAFRPLEFDAVAADIIDLCLRWPGVPRPAGAGTPAPYPAMPALLLQGGEDLRTPPEESAHVAAQMPGAERVVVPGVGHAASLSDPSGCAADTLLRFLSGRPAGGDCPRVPTGVPALPLPPPRMAGVSRLRELHAGRTGAVPDRVARTAAAVGLTLDDVRLALSPAFLAPAGGGLRGGTFRVGPRGLVLAGYEAVGGVRVSGRERGARLVLRVGGPAAAPGTLTVAPTGRFRGTLGGRSVAGRLPHRPPHADAGAGAARAARVSRVAFARVP
jgi:pimeloyl-ACP methyl ester carboxylesterase